MKDNVATLDCITKMNATMPMMMNATFPMFIIPTRVIASHTQNTRDIVAATVFCSRCSTALRHSLYPASRPLPETCSDVREDCGEAECRPHGRDGSPRCQAGGAAPGERSWPWTTAYGPATRSPT